MTLSKHIRTGLALLFLAMSGAACTTVRKINPPSSLLADCPHAAEPAEHVNGALAKWLQDEQHALDACNADKAALRAWAAQK